MSSLKDALLKAGFKPAKKENERPKVTKPASTPGQSQGQNHRVGPDRPYRPGVSQNNNRPIEKKIHSHQATRNFCEVCERVQPDVEHFKHRNPTVQGNWICIACADKNEIPDSTRTTAQSDMSKKKMFRRYFGATNQNIRPEPTGGSNSGHSTGNGNDR